MAFNQRYAHAAKNADIEDLKYLEIFKANFQVLKRSEKEVITKIVDKVT